MLFKLIALGLVVANPAPLPLKTADDRWFELGNIKGTDATEINKIIGQEWGLTINDFKWVEEEWFEHDGVGLDSAYELNFEYSYTTFWERYHY